MKMVKLQYEEGSDFFGLTPTSALQKVGRVNKQ